MKKQRNALWAGLFIIVSIVLIIGVIVGIKGIGRLIEPMDVHIVRFSLNDDLSGLRVGDDVRVGGLRVGSVREIDLVSDGETPHILVRFSIPQRVALRSDATITVQTTITGTTNLNIDNLGGEGEAIAAGHLLEGSPSTLQALMSGVRDLAPEISTTVRQIRTSTIPKVDGAIDQVTQTAATFDQTGQHASALVQEIHGKVDPVIEQYSTIADSATRALDAAGGMLGESKGDFRTSMSNVAALTGDLREKVGPILDKMDTLVAQAQTSVEGVNTALEDIKVITTNTRELTGSIRSLVTGNRSRLDNMIASLKTTSDNLKAASAEIRRSPWRLLYRPKPGEVANLNLYDSARQFAEGASHLSDAASALRDAMDDPTLSEEQLQPLVEQLDETFQNFQQIEQQLWQNVRP